ncbi:hypothetical protein MMPV_008276 [Pyropia vietnamensis]
MATPSRSLRVFLLLAAITAVVASGAFAAPTTAATARVGHVGQVPSGAIAAHAPDALSAKAGGSSAQPSSLSVKEVGLNFDVDVVGLVDSIVGAIQGAQDRGAFVRSTRDKVAYWHMRNGKQIIDDYNVLVFNRQQPHEEDLSGVEMYRDFKYQGITFGVWVFDKGTFTNQGDGGYENWAFRGSFDRHDMFVRFHSRK